LAYFVKMSFRKDSRIIFLRGNVEFKKKISKKVGGKAAVRLSWRNGKMGHGAGPVWEGETR
jgi:hypothetical protein